MLGCRSESLENKTATSNQLDKVLLFGTLYNQDERQYVEQAEIQIRPGYKKVHTDQDGNFLIDELDRGQFEIVARKGIYTASAYVSTRTTDFLSVDMTFGSTALNSNDISFLADDGVFTDYKTKKLQDNESPDVYASLFDGLNYSFDGFGSIDWHPLTSNLLILSAKESGKTTFNVYECNTLTKDCTLLIENSLFDTTSPSYSPDGRLFSYLQNGQIYISGNLTFQQYDGSLTTPEQWNQPYARCFTDNQLPVNRPLIRDGKLIFRNLDSNKFVLKIQERHEQANSTDPVDTLPSIPPLPTGLNHTQANDEFRNLLNRYFNINCSDNLGVPTPCPNIIDQFYYDQGPGAGSNYGSSTNYDQIGPFDALNFPAECPVEMANPVWSRSGNRIAFLARPTGCNAQRQTVCGRTCGDESWEIFIAPAVTCIENTEWNNKLVNDIIQLDDIARLDKFHAIQVTNDRFREINLSWEPKSSAIIYEKVVPVNGMPSYYLHSSNPTTLGFQTRVLLPQSFVQQHAQISQDGHKIVFVSQLKNSLNPNGLSQIYSADWTGVVGKEYPVTFYDRETPLKYPKIYKKIGKEIPKFKVKLIGETETSENTFVDFNAAFEFFKLNQNKPDWKTAWIVQSHY